MIRSFHGRAASLATIFAASAGALCCITRHAAAADGQQSTVTSADTAPGKAKTALQRCLDSALVLNHAAASKVMSLAQSKDTAGIAAVLEPMRVYAKSCESLPEAKGAQGVDLGALASAELLAGDFTAGHDALVRYIKDDQIPKIERSGTVEAAQRLAGAAYGKSDPAIYAPFVDLADSLGFPRGRLNTRITLAQVDRASPSTADKSYPLIRDVMTIAKEDPDTTNRAKRARAIGTIVKMVQGWAQQDGKPYDAQVISDMAKQTFGMYQPYKAMFDATALIGSHAEPIKAARWLNAAANAGTSKTFGDGQVYLLEFTAHWCGPCRMSYGPIQTMYDKYKSKGLNVMFVTQTYGYFEQTEGLSAEAELDSLKHYFGEHKVTYPVAVTGPFAGVSSDLAQNTNSLNYSATGLPTIVLIDRQGTIRGLWQGWADEIAPVVDGEIAKALADGAETSTPAGSSKGR